MGSSAAIAFDGLTKAYAAGFGRPRFLALDSLTLRVERGTVYGLLGPNGCGKTTALKILLGLVFPTAGHARLFGQPSCRPAARCKVGYLAEVAVQSPRLTGREAVSWHGRLAGVPRALLRERVDQVLEQVALTPAADRPIGTYSKGLRQRLGLAQALVHDPELLVLDEPTSGLDPAATGRFVRLLRRLQTAGKTILLTSHRMDEVTEVCDRVALLHRGRLLIEGPVSTLLERTDRQRIEVDALPPEQQAELARWLAARGGELHGVSPVRTAWSQWYPDEDAAPQPTEEEER